MKPLSEKKKEILKTEELIKLRENK